MEGAYLLLLDIHDKNNNYKPHQGKIKIKSYWDSSRVTGILQSSITIIIHPGECECFSLTYLFAQLNKAADKYQWE